MISLITFFATHQTIKTRAKEIDCLLSADIDCIEALTQRFF